MRNDRRILVLVLALLGSILSLYITISLSRLSMQAGFKTIREGIPSNSIRGCERLLINCEIDKSGSRINEVFATVVNACDFDKEYYLEFLNDDFYLMSDREIILVASGESTSRSLQIDDFGHSPEYVHVIAYSPEDYSAYLNYGLSPGTWNSLINTCVGFKSPFGPLHTQYLVALIVILLVVNYLTLVQEKSKVDVEFRSIIVLWSFSVFLGLIGLLFSKVFLLQLPISFAITLTNILVLLRLMFVLVIQLVKIKRHALEDG